MFSPAVTTTLGWFLLGGRLVLSYCSGAHNLGGEQDGNGNGNGYGVYALAKSTAGNAVFHLLVFLFL